MKFLTPFAFANAQKPHAAMRDTFARERQYKIKN